MDKNKLKQSQNRMKEINEKDKKETDKKKTPQFRDVSEKTKTNILIINEMEKVQSNQSQKRIKEINQNDKRETDKKNTPDFEDDKSKKMNLGRIEQKEKDCASRLKEVHFSNGDNRLKQEAECLEELGDIYLEKSELTNSGRDYIKSAGLYNAAMVRYDEERKREMVKRKLTNLMQIFIGTKVGRTESCDDYIAKYAEDITKNKQILQKLRDYCKQELEDIEIKYPAYKSGESIENLSEMTEGKKQLEIDRAQAIEQLYLHISNGIKSFAGQLLTQCIEVMGRPPCKYAWIGLGSLARDLATPYSDLESAILIEEDKEECRQYFRLLSYFLHIKVIDLGQTIIPILAIKSLYNDGGSYSWFQDFITPRGISFDGNVSWASKIPYGREATLLKPEPMELIKIPIQMAQLLTEKNAQKEGYHLADMLVDVTLIIGENELVDQFKYYSHQILSKPADKDEKNKDETKSVQQARGYSNLEAGIKEFNILTTLEDSKGKSYNVKKEIFRFPTIIINNLSWAFNITTSNFWNAIRELHKRQVINSDAKHNLIVIISLAAELRIASYIKHGKQSEELVVREFDVLDDSKFLPFSQEKIFRYYSTALPFKGTIESCLYSKNCPSLAVSLINNNFCQCSHYYKGKIYVRLTLYSKAEACYKRALEEREEEIPELYLDLAWLEMQQGKLKEAKEHVHAYSKEYSGKQPENVSTYLGYIYGGLGNYDKAVKYHQESLIIKKQLYGEHAAHPDIASSLIGLGKVYAEKGNYEKFIEYNQESFAMMKQLYGEHSAHPGTALTLCNLGAGWYFKGDYFNAIEYFQKSLAMSKQLYGQDAVHPDIADLLFTLGSAWLNKGDYDKALEYCQESHAMNKQMYGESTAHPKMAQSLSNLGIAWNIKGAYDKAIEYYQETLAMNKQIYGKHTAHRVIAASLNNLGLVWDDKGDFEKAIEYHQESLAMRKEIYGESTAHPDIADSLNNLGKVWDNKGDHEKGVEYYQESLFMKQQMYGQSAAHKDIAACLHNLGSAWNDMGDSDKAFEYLQESLGMRKQINGEDAAHPEIAASLHNLGSAYRNKGNYAKAVEYYQESFAMKKHIYGEDAAHADIAASLHNLGMAWSDMRDYDNAFQYYTQALQIYQKVYGIDSTHPNIRKTEYKLKKLNNKKIQQKDN